LCHRTALGRIAVQYTPIVTQPTAWGSREILGVVLVGGASRRMGQAKSTLAHEGMTLSERVVRSLRPHVGQVVLAGAGPVPGSLEGLTRLADPPEVGGPLAGVLAAMRWAPESAWIVAACDMPRITAESVEWLLEQRRPEAWAVLPSSREGHIEAVFAVYEPPVRPLLEERSAAGRWGLRHLARHDRVISPAIPSNLVDAWTNINIPEELQSEE
jgi:molybdopterin-guanine dinucleotide biosynthesis protein A